MYDYWILISKVLFEGLAVAFVSYFLTRMTTDVSTVLMIGLTASLTFFILDYYTPEIGLSARQGSGFGIGLNQALGFQMGGDNLNRDYPDLSLNSSSCNLSSNSTVISPVSIVNNSLGCINSYITVTDDCTKPINSNTHEYKLMRGFNSYYLRASGAPTTPISLK